MARSSTPAAARAGLPHPTRRLRAAPREYQAAAAAAMAARATILTRKPRWRQAAPRVRLLHRSQTRQLGIEPLPLAVALPNPTTTCIVVASQAAAAPPAAAARGG